MHEKRLQRLFLYFERAIKKPRGRNNLNELEHKNKKAAESKNKGKEKKYKNNS
ncbi:hypothetical protein [Aedoeadaptatus acetigenes]|uniref:hypothetical protein n=1 Tax=Aedoeadaptatus acetigenes TaxID=2981723 RepID=UPI002265CE24|nr:hypothetical protein [Aedoeadaptatus acetigenes]MCU6786123.1 hypothetical protein [Aedoeadaptatus acetigenes]